jgi:hypothetical protein
MSDTCTGLLTGAGSGLKGPHRGIRAIGICEGPRRRLGSGSGKRRDFSDGRKAVCCAECGSQVCRPSLQMPHALWIKLASSERVRAPLNPAACTYAKRCALRTSSPSTSLRLPVRQPWLPCSPAKGTSGSAAAPPDTLHSTCSNPGRQGKQSPYRVWRQRPSASYVWQALHALSNGGVYWPTQIANMRGQNATDGWAKHCHGDSFLKSACPKAHLRSLLAWSHRTPGSVR